MLSNNAILFRSAFESLETFTMGRAPFSLANALVVASAVCALAGRLLLDVSNAQKTKLKAGW
jgi:hypothetical protein